MAEQNLLSIFGPTPEQLQKQLQQQQQERSLFAARMGPAYSAGYGLGSLLEGVVSKVFGLEDPELKKAKDVREAYQSVLERSGGTIGDRGAFLDQMQYELQERGQPELAATAGLSAEDFRLTQQKREQELLDAEAFRRYRESQTAENEMDFKTKAQPMVYALGSQLDAMIKSNAKPEVIQAALQKALPFLEKVGVDTEAISSAQSLPDLQAAVAGLRAYGTDVKTESKNVRAAASAAFKEKQFNKTYSLKEKLFTSNNEWKQKNYALSQRRVNLLESNANNAQKFKTIKLLSQSYGDQIKVNQGNIKEIDNEIKRLNTSLMELQKGNVYYDSKGQLISTSNPEIVEDQIEAFNKEIQSLEAARQQLLYQSDQLDSERSNIIRETAGLAPQKQFSTNTGYKFVTGVNAKDKEAYLKAMKAARTSDERLNIQRKAFEFGLVEPK
jgi:hypothetical protein